MATLSQDIITMPSSFDQVNLFLATKHLLFSEQKYMYLRSVLSLHKLTQHFSVGMPRMQVLLNQITIL